MFDLAGHNTIIFEALVAHEMLTASQVTATQSHMQISQQSIDKALMSLGLIEEGALLRLIGETLGLPFLAEIATDLIDTAAFRQLGASFWEIRTLLPIRLSSHRLTLITSAPAAIDSLEEAAFLLREETDIALASSQSIRQAMRSLKTPTDESGQPKDLRPTAHASLPQVTTSEDGAVAQGVDAMVADAVTLRASDIHLNALGDLLHVRLRVDGILRGYQISRDLDAQAVFARLKLMSGMSITERRMPQDGSCRINHAGRPIELRLSTLPTQSGESMVCRVLDPLTARAGWSELGFPDGTAQALVVLVEKPHGLLVISGPTGSGKTTTLYTAIRHLNDGTRKILTVEDPIEQTIEGVEQVQVNTALGLDFGRVLRTTLRHDPDVLMIGEIRDEETAEIACRAALIGRLVLATIHASSVQLVRERFINLGVPAYLVDEVLIGVLSQRLTTKTCAHCSGDGCADCDGSGINGRRANVALWIAGQDK